MFNSFEINVTQFLSSCHSFWVHEVEALHNSEHTQYLWTSPLLVGMADCHHGNINETGSSFPGSTVLPILQQCYVWAILLALLIGTVFLHHSLIIWIVYQRVLGFRLSYRTAVELQYIAIHVIQNLYALLHRWGTHVDMTPPQGSTLSPTLLRIFINGLLCEIEKCPEFVRIA